MARVLSEARYGEVTSADKCFDSYEILLGNNAIARFYPAINSPCLILLSKAYKYSSQQFIYCASETFSSE